MVSYKKQELLTRRENLISPPVLVVSVLLIFWDFCVVICLSSSYVLLSKCYQCLRTGHFWSLLRFSLTFICLFTSCVLCTQCSQCLRTVHSWLLLRFSLTSCALCTQCCQCLRTVHYWLLLWFSLTFTCLFTSCVLCTQMLPVSPDCPFLIAPSVFSNIYIFFIRSICWILTAYKKYHWLLQHWFVVFIFTWRESCDCVFVCICYA